MLSDEELIERAKQGEVHGGGQRQIQLLCERLEFYEGSERGERNVSQAKAFAGLVGLRDQVQKEHWLNVHFRAFELSHAAWQFHILAKHK